MCYILWLICLWWFSLRPFFTNNPAASKSDTLLKSVQNRFKNNHLACKSKSVKHNILIALCTTLLKLQHVSCKKSSFCISIHTIICGAKLGKVDKIECKNIKNLTLKNGLKVGNWKLVNCQNLVLKFQLTHITSWSWFCVSTFDGRGRVTPAGLRDG